MIEVVVNGLAKEFIDGTTLNDMIVSLEIADKVMASAVNMNIVKKKIGMNMFFKIMTRLSF